MDSCSEPTATPPPDNQHFGNLLRTWFAHEPLQLMLAMARAYPARIDYFVETHCGSGPGTPCPCTKAEFRRGINFLLGKIPAK